ncbi:unnamed protein product, partial [Dibothriocephalus latus]
MDNYALVAPEMLSKQLQPEYWQSPGVPTEVGNDASSPSLSHLSLRAFDSFLCDIAQYATDGLRIGVFLDYLTPISKDATEQSFPPTFRLLADLLANFLSDFQTAVATLEHKIRQGELRTLMGLLQSLQPWPLRLRLVAGLLLQTVPSQLTALHADSSAVLFLNTLEE